MLKITLPLLTTCLCAWLHAGAVCDWKANDLKERVAIAKNKGLEAKTSKLQERLKDFLKTCRDEDVIAEVAANVSSTKLNLKEAKERLDGARIDGNSRKIRQAELDFKIANMEYVAAEQEMLRMKDLLKSSKK